MKRIKRLVQEFAGDAPSAECSIKGKGKGKGPMGVLERWFTELGVGWVLQLDGGACASAVHDTFYTRSWIRVLSEITDTIHLVTPFFHAQHLRGRT